MPIYDHIIARTAKMCVGRIVICYAMLFLFLYTTEKYLRGVEDSAVELVAMVRTIIQCWGKFQPLNWLAYKETQLTIYGLKRVGPELEH